MPELPNILIFEEHSSVLPQWWRRGLRNRTLICLDAHLDLQSINRERLSRLEHCSTVENVQALEKPHHLMPDRHFSYSLENHLYAAHELGIIDHLIWVTPPHVKTGYSERALLQLQQMEGVLPEELASFQRTSGGWIEGRLLDVPITICDVYELATLQLPSDSLLDIDTDFFVTTPGDEPWIHPREVFTVLRRLALNHEIITLTRSVNSGFTPLRYRYFADYLATLWQQRHHDADHYDRLFQLDRQLLAGDCQRFAAECHRELEEHPECAACYYLLSLDLSRPERAEQYRCEAARLDSGYQPDVLRSACELRNRHLTIDTSHVHELERQLSLSNSRPEQETLTHVALGLLYCVCGQIEHAIHQYQQCIQQFEHHPELSLEIGKLLAQSQQVEPAIPFLEEALQDDKSRAAGHALLGEVYGMRGQPVEAVQQLEEAYRFAPAWGRVVHQLARLHQQLGNQPRCQSLIEAYRVQQSRIAELKMQLGDADA